MNYHDVKILTDIWLNVVNQAFRWCPGMRSNFNWITTGYIPSIDVFIIESPMATMFFFTFSWWASGWRSLKLTCSSLNLSSFGTFDSFFLSFCKGLFVLVWLILLSFIFLVTEWFWAKTFWAWIRLLLCSRMESISFCLFFMSSFSSLFSFSKSLILVCKLSTVPWSILVEVFHPWKMIS